MPWPAGSPVLKLAEGGGGGQRGLGWTHIQGFDIDCCFCCQMLQFENLAKQKAVFIPSSFSFSLLMLFF